MWSSEKVGERENYSIRDLLAQHRTPGSFREFESDARNGRRCGPCTTRGGSMAESEETYDDKRARMLETLLRELAARIGELDGRGELLRYAGELTKRIGDIRSELFHYEVRATYDTPDIAENRRIVDDAQKRSESQWQTKEWTADEDDDPAW